MFLGFDLCFLLLLLKAGYSSPTQSAIIKDLNLSVSEVSGICCRFSFEFAIS